MDGWRNTFGRHLDPLGHGGLFADQLHKLVDHEFSVDLENRLTWYWMVEVEMIEWYSAETWLVKVYIVLQSECIHPLEQAH